MKKSIESFQATQVADIPEVRPVVYKMGDYLNREIFINKWRSPLDKFVLFIENIQTTHNIKRDILGTYRPKSGIGFSNMITLEKKS